MRFLADMGVSWRVVAWLREKGHDALHLRDEGLQRLPNGKIFEKASSEKRIVLTFDLDFGEIMALSNNRPMTVIIFRLHNTRSAHVIDRLNRVLEDSGDAIVHGAIIVVEELRHRVRRLPFN
ncbi:MAG: DUF5615 family PIN-like protein [Candidatus Magnetominusculus sp. LBB02]|nr:DUF5615 family PIN-like protein [Candidatus Magnetominusculus sp. LBB02]